QVGENWLAVNLDCACSGIAARAWDFGDGTGSAESSPQHTFSPGRFTVRLWGVDASGCVGSDSVEVVVSTPPYQPPFCTAAVDNPAGKAPLNVTFTATYVDPNEGGSITSAVWTFDDGSTSAQPIVQRTFDVPGARRAVLKV